MRRFIRKQRRNPWTALAAKSRRTRALPRILKSLGVDTVFGLMSDDTAVFCIALDGLGIAFHGARHENQAVAMAEGYAFATGRLGVAIIGRGPATANGLHAAVAASRMGSKLLIIYGEQAQPTGAPNPIGPDYPNRCPIRKWQTSQGSIVIAA